MRNVGSKYIIPFFCRNQLGGIRNTGLSLVNNRLFIKNDYIGFRYYAKTHRKNKLHQSNKLKELNFAIPNFISVTNLANLLNCRVQTLINDLTKLGFKDISNGYILTKEYTELILQEYNYYIPETVVQDSQNIYDELKQSSNPKALKKRPPIVTILGHVDHGKTTIIDYLRKSSVVEQEHGGITQHIGAFQVTTPVTKQKITFLDTPGHAAFLKMRERGANITDIIVLVISIEDSIMPQTVEAIKHIKNSGNELIVAITKIDKFPRLEDREKRLIKITNDLMQHGIMVEGSGGDVQLVQISAKTGENMEDLEESIVSLSVVMDIRSENLPSTMIQGWIVESKIKNKVGNIATVLIKKGTLKKGDILLCGNTYCRVKNMTNDSNKPVTQALPAEAVEVLGWKDLPNVGDEVIQVKNEAIAKKYISKRMALLEVENKVKSVEKYNQNRAVELQSKVSTGQDELEDPNLDEEDNINNGPKEVNFIIKTDVSGSAEAVKESIEHLGNDEVKCNIISTSVGIPTDSDLKMANLTSSTIICFNLDKLPNEVINNKFGIPIKRYNVIYKLIEDVIDILVKNMKPVFEKKIVATLELREVFEYKLKKKIIRIAGCKVSNGEVKRNSKVQITRNSDDNIIYEGQIQTLKHGKDDIASTNKGHECGITFTNNFENFQAGDKISVYELVEVPRHL